MMNRNSWRKLTKHDNITSNCSTVLVLLINVLVLTLVSKCILGNNNIPQQLPLIVQVQQHQLCTFVAVPTIKRHTTLPRLQQQQQYNRNYANNNNNHKNDKEYTHCSSIALNSNKKCNNNDVGYSDSDRIQQQQIVSRVIRVASTLLFCIISTSNNIIEPVYAATATTSVPTTTTEVVTKIQVQQKVLSAGGTCIQGQGDGCTNFAENNEYIQMLQQRSLTNKDKNEKEALYSYYMKNYPDYFISLDKVMLKKQSDNTFIVVSTKEYDQLLKNNLITVEIPTAKNGKFTDWTQKPITVYKDM